MSLAQTLIIESSSTGTSARSSVSLTNSNYILSLHWGCNEKHTQTKDITTKNRAQNQTQACVGSVAILNERLHVALIYRVVGRKVMQTDSHNY